METLNFPDVASFIYPLKTLTMHFITHLITFTHLEYFQLINNSSKTNFPILCINFMLR